MCRAEAILKKKILTKPGPHFFLCFVFIVSFLNIFEIKFFAIPLFVCLIVCSC
uniref:Uncharacterized protein n=1 Tax=Anguilla anguilla TaxID=7936 RepID=A0A0E9RIT4_ANGAN